MLDSLQSLSRADVAAITALFVLVLAGWLVVILVWYTRSARRQQQIDLRLGLTVQDTEPGRVLRLWRDGREATTRVPGGGPRLSPLQRLDLMRQDAGWRMSAGSLLLGVAGAMLLLFAFAYTWTGYLVAGLITGAAVPLLVWVYLNRCLAQREQLFETQFLDALGLAARSLRAGHPLNGSFRLISDEIPAPVGVMFARICQQQALGMDLEQALREAAAGSANSEMKLFATSVAIQLKTGGNLADLMDRLADVIRDRMRLARRVRVLTAQTQFSKRVLLVLPFVTFVFLNFVNPAYMAPLYTTSLGQSMLVMGGLTLLMGAWLMNRMAVLRY